MTSGKDGSTQPRHDAKPTPSEPPKAADPSAAKIHALEEERDRLKNELADARDKFLRARADYENLVRRSQKDAADSVRHAKGAFLLRVVGIVETLGKAVDDLERSNPDAAKGLRMVLNDLHRFLKDEHLKEIETVGQMFNYRYHQAVESIEAADQPEGAILGVVQRGYLLNGEILRHALVKVAAPPKRAPAKDAAGEARKAAGAA